MVGGECTVEDGQLGSTERKDCISGHLGNMRIADRVDMDILMTELRVEEVDMEM